MIRRLDRRSFLRGAFGVAVGLPVLEIMLDGNGTALASGKVLSKRYLVGFAGASMGGDGDTVPNLFAPNTIGPDYDLKTGTATLANHGDVRRQVSIISGLRMPYNTGTGAPLGGWWQDFHTQALSPLISGTRGLDGHDYEIRGVTSDQVVADAIGDGTTFRSLQYQVQASYYLTIGSPNARDVLSYKSDGSGGLLAVPGQISPQAAYTALFTSFVPLDDAEAAAKARSLLKRQSVVDLVRADYDRLVPKLGTADRDRMERHLDEIRDLETQLDAGAPVESEICQQYPDPGADPPIGGSQTSVGVGADFDVNLGWSDETTRAQRFADLIHMAFACDLTRSVALLYTMAQCHLNVSSITGLPYDLHELSHSGLGTEAYSSVHAWHMDQWGYLVAKLRDTPEGAGTLLDNCAMVLLFEGGHGFDPGSSDEFSSHSTENMIVVTSGGAGGLKQGEHIVATGLHPVNVLNTAMAAVGVEVDLGEVTGTIPGLL